MKYLTYSTYILLILLFTCCKKKTNYQKITPVVKLSNALKIDSSTCEIPIDSVCQFFYKKVSYCPANNVLCGFNPKTNAVDFYDLAKNKYLYSAKLPKPKLDMINNVYAVLYRNKDSLFVVSGNYITLMDSSGKLKKSISINARSHNPVFRKINLYDWDTNNDLYFDEGSKQLNIPQISVEKPQGSSDYYELPFLAKVEIGNNNTITSLPVSYSSLYKLNYYGFMNYPQVIYPSKDIIVYTFPIEPNIYIFDRKSNTTKVVGGAIGPHNSISTSINWEASYDDDSKLKNMIENVNYVRFLYDPFRKLYYRLQYDALPEKNRETETQNDSHQILTIFNNKFQIIGVKDLTDRRYYLYTAFVAKKGLYLPAAKGNSTLRFKILTISNNEKS